MSLYSTKYRAKVLSLLKINRYSGWENFAGFATCGRANKINSPVLGGQQFAIRRKEDYNKMHVFANRGSCRNDF